MQGTSCGRASSFLLYQIRSAKVWFGQFCEYNVVRAVQSYWQAVRSYAAVATGLKTRQTAPASGFTVARIRAHFSGKFGLPQIGEALPAYVARRALEGFRPIRRLAALYLFPLSRTATPTTTSSFSSLALPSDNPRSDNQLRLHARTLFILHGSRPGRVT